MTTWDFLQHKVCEGRSFPHKRSISLRVSPCRSGQDWWRCQTPSVWRCGWSGESRRWMSSHSLHWHSERGCSQRPWLQDEQRYITCLVFGIKTLLTSCIDPTGRNSPWTTAPETSWGPAAPGSRRHNFSSSHFRPNEVLLRPCKQTHPWSFSNPSQRERTQSPHFENKLEEKQEKHVCLFVCS